MSVIPAFPSDPTIHPDLRGMALRDYFAGQALTNHAICNDSATDWQLKAWFGPHRSGITAAEIVAKKASAYADAMMAAREVEIK